MSFPMIKIWILYINRLAEPKYTDTVIYLSRKRAKKYFENLNKCKEYEVSLRIGTLRLW